ncbi:MAG: carboxypeptidase regulatory-like domain-containing protein [Acidobacteriia bacterium]|nr:carboxypeptidase regulatory-like domain-containing protein [Terriglobia bacterium]
MKILKNACLVGLAVLSSALAQSTATVGTLQGLVTDAQGKPLAGAEVRYRRLFQTVLSSSHQPLPAPGEAVIQSKVTTDANGAYTLPNLPAGDYALCGSVPTLPYLDPCQWATSPRTTVAAAAPTKHTLILTKGVFLKVRVNDPLGLLPQTQDGPLKAGNLIVGVTFAKGAYLGAQNTGVDSAGRNYQMIIPAGAPLSLWLFSRHVALKDANGNPVDVSGARIAFQATAGSDQTFTFTVSGPLAQSQ